MILTVVIVSFADRGVGCAEDAGVVDSTGGFHDDCSDPRLDRVSIDMPGLLWTGEENVLVGGPRGGGMVAREAVVDGGLNKSVCVLRSRSRSFVLSLSLSLSLPRSLSRSRSLSQLLSLFFSLVRLSGEVERDCDIDRDDRDAERDRDREQR